MKVRIFAGTCVILALIAVGTSQAQSPAIGGGVKGGPNFSTISGDIDTGVSKSVRTGLAIGGFLVMPNMGMLAFEPEFFYSMEGVKISAKDGGVTFDGTAKVDVIRIPLLLRVGPAARGGYLLVGPSIDFITRAKQSLSSPPNTPDEDFKDDLKSAVTSVVVAAGYKAGRGLVEGRYVAGIQDVNKSGSSSTVNKNRSFTILFGVAY